MSDRKPSIAQDKNCLENYNVSQTEISKGDSIISFLKIEEEKCAKNIYEKPLPYIYLPVTENVNEERMNNLLIEDISVESFWIPESKSDIFASPFKGVHDAYSDDGADEKFLKSMPVSFFILSKPNIGEIELAENLSKHWKCVLITPELLLQQEILSETRVGKCIEFNLKMGRAIGPEVILKLASRRVRSATAKHRGFVIAGFPLIPNKLYSEDPISSESAIFNVQEIFDELPVGYDFDHSDTPSTKKGSKVTKSNLEIPEEEEVEEEQIFEHKKKKKSIIKPIKSEHEDIDFGPDKSNILKNTVSFELLNSVEHQLEFLFNLVKSPTVFIYLLCGNLDVLNKVENLRFDISQAQEIAVKRENADTIFKQEFASALNLFEYDDEDEIDYRTMVQLPVHTSKSVSDQLLVFKYRLQCPIDKKLFEQDIRYYIKLDGRLPVSKMFNTLRLRIKTLGFRPVLIPSKLSTIDEISGEYVGEDAQQPDYEKLSPEEAFKKFRGKNIVGSMYKWHLSNWGYKCPVALKNGKVTKGKAANAVQFMNKIFFLSDDDALLNFCRNPRLYLLPYKAMFPARFFIFGPNNSGKSCTAQFLSYIFQCKILNQQALEEEYKEKKKQEFLDKIKTAAITEGLMSLMEQREKDRDRKIKLWLKSAKLLLITEFPELYSSKDTQIFNTNSQQSTIDPSSNYSIASNLSLETHSELIAELECNNLPTDKSQVKLLLENPDQLMDFLPDELLQPIKQPTVFDSYVTQYVDDVIENTIIEDTDLTKEEIVDMYRNAIRQTEVEFYEHKGKWIIDGFPPDLDILRELSTEALADEVICLRDEDPENVFLNAKFARKDDSVFKDYKNVFQEFRRFSAADRVPVHQISSVEIALDNLTKYKSIHMNIIEDIETVKDNKDEEYAEHLTDFNNKWFEVRDYLTANLCDPPIEINVANKTIPDLFLEALLRVEDKYRRVASVVTEEDRIQEKQDFGGNTEFSGEGGGEEPLSLENFLENRRYGDSTIYCPVALHDYFVLWKGKDNYSAEFENKLYFLSSEDTLNAFIKEPRKYVINKPMQIIPPVRVCLIGPVGSGKTVLAEEIKRNFGVHYFNFETLLQQYFGLDGTLKIDDTICKPEKYLSENELLHSEDLSLIKKYFEGDTPIPDYIMKAILFPIWFEHPFKTTGFILDGFPRIIEDVTYMCKNFLIPDIVIELSLDQEVVRSRVFKNKLDQWQEDIDRKKELKQIENEKAIENWQAQLDERASFLLEELKEERRQEYLLTQPPVPPYSSPTESYAALPEMREMEEEEIELSMFVYDPAQEQEDLEQIKAKILEEMPKPEFTDIWETLEEAASRIEECLTESYSRDLNLFNILKSQVKSENIDYSLINANKTSDQVFNDVTKLTENYKFRTNALFERVYSITIDVAEKLLEVGYYFLSKFGKTCPVQVYEKINPVQSYLVSEHKMSIFPMIHRRYIYFICSYDHREKFKQNPLLYIENDDFELPLLPLKLAVIGPPKCGKSLIADRFQKEYGFKIISRGQAIRYVLRQLPNCELAQNIKKVLFKGWSVTHDMIASAVEALTLDAKSISQGYILDGFPCTARRVPVPDERYDYLCNYFKPASKVPAFLNVVDIAGLVKGASEGQGLGNAFLSHISACDAIFHLCRAFEDDDVTHVEGDVNPVRDLEIIFEELRLKDEEQLMKNLDKLERTVGRGADKKLKPEYDALLKVKQVLVDEKNHIRFADWHANDIDILNKYLFLTSKPGIYLINLAEKDYIRKKNKWLIKIKEWVDKNDPGATIIPFSGAYEQKLSEMEEDERKKCMEENKTTSALDKIIVQGYKALQLEYFFTSGTDEVKAWTIQKGTKAPQAAGRIHTDFEKGFIMAEVMKFIDFKEEGSEAACKGAGKYRQQGRNYTVEDGDIIFFKFNAGAGLKDAKKK